MFSGGIDKQHRAVVEAILPNVNFYTLWKHQKTVQFSGVIRGYRNVTLGRND